MISLQSNLRITSSKREWCHHRTPKTTTRETNERLRGLHRDMDKRLSIFCYQAMEAFHCKLSGRVAAVVAVQVAAPGTALDCVNASANGSNVSYKQCHVSAFQGSFYTTNGV